MHSLRSLSQPALMIFLPFKYNFQQTMAELVYPELVEGSKPAKMIKVPLKTPLEQIQV